MKRTKPNFVTAVASSLMKPKRLKVYARSELISTKLPIVRNLIEIIAHIVLDRYTAIREGFVVKLRHM